LNVKAPIPFSSPPPIVETRNLHKVFAVGDQIVQALDGINVRIRSGEFVSIMGPSGSGKSTLLYLIGGLDHVSEGEINVANMALEAMDAEALAQFRQETIGFIFQSFHLIPTMTALDNVALPGVFAGLGRDEREERALELLTLLKMEDRARHRPAQLSGGQQQRVAIARALFLDPALILADEPTGALDSRTGQIVMQMLRWLCTVEGKTVIVVTHDPKTAGYADRILRLEDGRVAGDRYILPRVETDAI
jgi:ABC-type lipoprotein export system ATPase subunit